MKITRINIPDESDVGILTNTNKYIALNLEVYYTSILTKGEQVMNCTGTTTCIPYPIPIYLYYDERGNLLNDTNLFRINNLVQTYVRHMQSNQEAQSELDIIETEIDYYKNKHNSFENGQFD